MKSKIIIFSIIAFVFIITISLFLKNTLLIGDANAKDFLKQQNDENINQASVRITPTPAVTPVPTPTPVETYDPNEVFIDEFNDDYLDEIYWNKLERETNYNAELQAYVKENVFVEDGCLVLLAENNDGTYKSGLVNTKSKIEFQYGTISIRLKYPSGKSFFPAIWMLPADDTSYPEIDIMEVVGHRPSTLYFVYHYYTKEKRKFYTRTTMENYEDFHTYSLKWTPETLTWYVDGVRMLEVTEDIPNEPMYLIVNFAIGGVWPGSPDRYTVFPAKVLVDYVKIAPYKLTEEEKTNDIY